MILFIIDLGCKLEGNDSMLEIIVNPQAVCQYALALHLVIDRPVKAAPFAQREGTPPEIYLLQHAERPAATTSSGTFRCMTQHCCTTIYTSNWADDRLRVDPAKSGTNNAMQYYIAGVCDLPKPCILTQGHHA